MQDTKQIGKTPTKQQHPVAGLFKTVEFKDEQEFAKILLSLSVKEAFTVGLFPDEYNYVPRTNTTALTKPKHTTRTADAAAPGHVLLIDCDFPLFYHLKGKELHTFLSTFLPDIFQGAAYVATNSSSFYTKGEKTFHQYYFFKNATDMSQLHLLLDKLFQQHNLITYKLAKNYSRSYIKTPIDTKLHELHMPIYEMTQPRLDLFNSNKEPLVEIGPGHAIEMPLLSLPLINTDKAEEHYDLMFEQAETERKRLLLDYVTEKGGTQVDATYLEKMVLPASFELVQDDGTHTSVTSLLVNHILNDTPIHNLFQAIGEPTYAKHQTAKLFTNDSPFELGNIYMMDQAHGGSAYEVIFSYEDLDSILGAAKQRKVTPRDFVKLLSAKNEILAPELKLLGALYVVPKLYTPGDIVKALNNNNITTHNTLDEEQTTISVDDYHTILAAMQQGISLDNPTRTRLQQKLNLEQLFNGNNVQQLRDSVYEHGNDIILKPGKHHGFQSMGIQQATKYLAPKYPPSNISELADEKIVQALITKYTATNKVENLSYMASMHGEKLHFGDGRVIITYQQPRPSFANVNTAVKQTLDGMSQATFSEMKDIYMNESMGAIWAVISELSYIKKINPQLKKDFLWLHMPSDVGKTFNMDIANIITPYEKGSLDQILEQAAKISPSALAKAAFLFNDEVKQFKHSWNELGAFYNIKGMYAASSTQTQLPLKVLASAEAVMTKGTTQQINRLMVMDPKIQPFSQLGVAPEHEHLMTAVTHQVIYEAFEASYDKYASISEQKALQTANLAGKGFATRYAPKDMINTEEYVHQAVAAYLEQEIMTVYLSGAKKDPVPDWLSRYVKHAVIKDNVLYVNMKKTDAPAFIEYVLAATTSKIETRSMGYEALNLTWEDIGFEKIKTQKTIGGKPFYGHMITIPISEEFTL